MPFEVFVHATRLPCATVLDFQRDVSGAALALDLLLNVDFAAVVSAEADQMDGAKVMAYLPRHVAEFVHKAYTRLLSRAAIETRHGRYQPQLHPMLPPADYVSIDIQDPLGTQAYDEYLQDRVGA